MNIKANELFRAANVSRPRDPLAIDLDGDGIETVGVAGSALLFDHNGDGVRTGTGWVKADDAWLVLDRNGNGLIDSGRELFGVDTLLSGTVGVDAQFARSGFDALRALDTGGADIGSGGAGGAGSPDGVPGAGDMLFDARDAAFGQVRLWQDLNQDGISQAGELSTLAQRNIASISLQPSGANVNLGNGNSVSGTAVVMRSNGVNTVAGTVAVSNETSAANLNLGVNPFYRAFAAAVPVTEQARGLPEMQGSGWVRDLREAMSLGTVQANNLRDGIAAYADAASRDDQRSMVDGILRQWAETNQSHAMGPLDDPHRRFVLAGDAATSARLQQIIPVLEVFNGQFVQEAGMQLPVTHVGPDGQTVATFHLIGAQAALMLQSYAALQESAYAALVIQTRLQAYLGAVELQIDATGIHFDASGMDAALDARQRVNPHDAIWDLVDLNRYAGASLLQVGYDGGQKLRQWVDALPPDAALRAELAAQAVVLATATGGAAVADLYLGDALGNAFSGADGDDVLDGGGGADTLAGDAGNDLLRGAAGADRLSGGDGDDILHGGADNDTLHGGLGNNLYRFGPGDGQDTIDYYADAAADKHSVLRFDHGILPSQVVARRVYDADFDRPDIGDGPGNGVYASLELSITGSGDRITVRGMFDRDDAGNPYNPVQRIEFADGTAWALPDIIARTQLSSEGADFLRGTISADVLSGGGGNDGIGGGAGDDAIDGGTGDDTLTGDSGNDVLDGGDGSDSLSGGWGHDLLRGGAGIDNLNGGDGNDTLDGGAGNDVLHGGLGNNVYLFGIGDGQDMVAYYSDTSAGKTNVLRFKDGVAPSQILARRVHDGDFVRPDTGDGPANASHASLELAIAGTTDRITLRGAFDYDNPGNQYNPVQRVEFADGTVWGLAEIVARTLQTTDGADLLRGTPGADAVRGGNGNDAIGGGAGDDALEGEAGNDTLAGDSDNDVLDGGDGNDSLSGGWGHDLLRGGAGIDSLLGGDGNDTLDGGAGNDVLHGGLGNNVYLFGIGDGQDMVAYYSDTSAGKYNVLRFKDGVAPSQILARRVHDGDFVRPDTGDGPANASHASLELAIAGTTDRITLRGAFDYDNPGNQYNPVQRIEFADGTIWGLAEIVARTLKATDGADSLRGTNMADTMRGGNGNDSLGGGAGDDALWGDAGADALTGNSGNDTLRGGLGDDILRGETGNDRLYGEDGDDTLVGDGASESGASQWVHTLQVVARGSVCQEVWPTMEVWVAGRRVQSFQVDSPDWKTYVVTAPLGLLAATVDIVFANDALRADLGQDRNLYLDRVEVNGRSISAREAGAVIDFGVGATAFDGLNTASTGGTLSSNGAIRISLLGSDLLDGGAGADQMAGGFGNDVYVVDNAGDTVSEAALGGHDIVRSSVAFTLGANVEDLELTGSAAIDGTGNAGSNTLRGNAAANRLDGQGGADMLVGGAGDDSYVVDDPGDIVYEVAGGGLDTVHSSISHTLRPEVEQLVLTGSLAINGTGNGLSNLLVGNAAANTLSAGAGDDSLWGGQGSDILQGGEGNDLLVGDAAIDCVPGPAQAVTERVDTLVVHARGTVCDGLWPTMEVWIDGVRIQSFAVDSTSFAAYTVTAPLGMQARAVDVLFVNDGARADLGQDRNLYLQRIDVNGRALDARAAGVVLDFGAGSGAFDYFNTATSWGGLSTNGALHFGLVGADLLDGGVGADRMEGGIGNDVYQVDNALDLVAEAAGDGHDIVRASASHRLAEHVEDLELIGTLAIDGAGNQGPNTLRGNAAANRLDGDAGSDLLVGGAGGDTYVLRRGHGSDSVYENDAAVGSTDVASFEGDIAADQLWFRHLGSSLEVSVIGTADRLTIGGWYSGSACRIEQFRAGDGQILLESQVQALVQAMAGFAPPAMGQLQLPQAQADLLQPMLAANWR